MLEEQAKYNQLMGELKEHASIKAALLVDSGGNVRARVGSARSMLGGASETNKMLKSEVLGADAPRESVYLAGAGSNFLVVIFSEHTQFDGIKTYVDALLRDLELNRAE